MQFIKHFLAEFLKLCTLDLKTTILYRLMCVFPYSSLCRILLSGSINKTTRERLFTSNTLSTFQTRKQLSCIKKVHTLETCMQVWKTYMYMHIIKVYTSVLMYMQANYNVRSIECAMLRPCEQICITICIVLKMTYFMHLNSSDQLLSPGKMFSNLVIV